MMRLAISAANMGVNFEAPVGLSTDAEPSAAGVAKLITQIKTEHVKALFLREHANDPRVVKQIANETGVQAGGSFMPRRSRHRMKPGASYLKCSNIMSACWLRP